ncbi:MAG TPA: B12-binding domain-containing radical SAM protein [Opitutaceae bacterium]|nr:B12-binding domain-containing radical SAM protein [Opitutaceae bacterium]
MNVLLLYPEFPDTFWGFKHALKFIRKKAAFPPLGLLTVAALLPAEWEKRLVDTNVRPLADRDLRWADVVFLSAMIAQRASVQELIVRCRAAGKRIVAGGPLFTSDHAQFPGVEHFVLNEAELTLPPFLRDFAAGTAGPLYRTTEFSAMSAAPVPLWHLAEVRRYASMSVQYSRGCPFDCEFCDVTAKFGHRPRTKTAAQVLAELDALVAEGWRGQVFFVDDNFIGNKHTLRTELLPRLIEWQRAHRRRLTFYTEASINLADDDALMRLLVEAGFDTVFIGIETPDDAALAECHKVQNRGRDLVADIKRIQRAGLQVQGGFIVGFDSDTASIFRRQLEFIQKSGIVTAMVGLLNALPDTKLHARLSREGRLRGRSSGDNVDGTTNFIPRMDLAELRAGYRRLMESIYAPRPYYQRVRTFLREFRQPRMASFTLRPALCLAFARSCFRLGLLGRERFQYWYLLAWTCLRRPRALPLAVTLAIYGHHFRRCSATLGRC